MNRIDFFKQNLYGKVLDIGSSHGTLHKEIMKKTNLHVFALDVVTINEKGEPVCYPNFKQGMAEENPYKDNVFDCVVMGEMLEHAKDPIKALQEAHRVLKPKGLLLISTPNKVSWINRTTKGYEGKAWKTGYGHNIIQTIGGLKELLPMIGYKIVTIYITEYRLEGNYGSRYEFFPLTQIRRAVTRVLPERLKE